MFLCYTIHIFSVPFHILLCILSLHIFISLSLCYAYLSFYVLCIYIHLWSETETYPFLVQNRFGHTAVSFNDSVYFYGGFNGQTKNDVVRFVPGQCRHVNDRETCISSKHGVKCVWSEKTGTCDTWSSESGKKTSLGKCLKDERNSSAICRSQTSCQSCLGNSDACVWCSDGCHKGDKCPQLKVNKETNTTIANSAF